MSLLHSYSFGTAFGQDGLSSDVLGLFTELVDNPNKKIEFASEIIDAGMTGAINFRRPFSIDAYEAGIRKNQHLSKEGRRSKEVFYDSFCTTSEMNDTEVRKGSTVSHEYVSTHAVNRMKDAFEELLLGEELKYAVETIRSLQPVLLIEERLDIIETLRQAISGIPESIKNLQRICDLYEVVAEQVQCVLASGYTFEEVFA